MSEPTQAQHKEMHRILQASLISAPRSRRTIDTTPETIIVEISDLLSGSELTLYVAQSGAVYFTAEVTHPPEKFDGKVRDDEHLASLMRWVEVGKE